MALEIGYGHVPTSLFAAKLAYEKLSFYIIKLIHADKLAQLLLDGTMKSELIICGD